MDKEEKNKIIKEELESFEGDAIQIKDEELDGWIKSHMKKAWFEVKNFKKAVERGASETIAASEILIKILKSDEVSKEEVDFMKDQSVDLAKAIAIIGIQAVPGSSVGIIILEKLAQKKGITLFPKENKLPDTNLS